MEQHLDQGAGLRGPPDLRIPAIAITCSDASRSGIPIDREQCGVGA
jgi:hypothetical protein